MEPTIIINGVPLNVSQAMVVRVAVISLRAEMSEPDVLGPDRVGKSIARAYLARLTEVLQLMEVL